MFKKKFIFFLIYYFVVNSLQAVPIPLQYMDNKNLDQILKIYKQQKKKGVKKANIKIKSYLIFFVPLLLTICYASGFLEMVKSYLISLLSIDDFYIKKIQEMAKEQKRLQEEVNNVKTMTEQQFPKIEKKIDDCFSENKEKIKKNKKEFNKELNEAKEDIGNLQELNNYPHKNYSSKNSYSATNMYELFNSLNGITQSIICILGSCLPVGLIAFILRNFKSFGLSNKKTKKQIMGLRENMEENFKSINAKVGKLGTQFNELLVQTEGIKNDMDGGRIESEKLKEQSLRLQASLSSDNPEGIVFKLNKKIDNHGEILNQLKDKTIEISDIIKMSNKKVDTSAENIKKIEIAIDQIEKNLIEFKEENQYAQRVIEIQGLIKDLRIQKEIMDENIKINREIITQMTNTEEHLNKKAFYYSYITVLYLLQKNNVTFNQPINTDSILNDSICELQGEISDSSDTSLSTSHFRKSNNTVNNHNILPTVSFFNQNNNRSNTNINNNILDSKDDIKNGYEYELLIDSGVFKKKKTNDKNNECFLSY